jgi:hypothetical protein
MELIDNINHLLGDNLKQSISPGAKLRIAASCFSIYAFEALKAELEQVESLEFIFTSPTFVPDEVTDSGRKVRREFHIPKAERERSFYGSEFEIQLKNQLTQKAIARECADWMRRKARFRSNRSKAPMQQFIALHAGGDQCVYQPLHGFTAVDLGYQRGDAVSNFVNKIDDDNFTRTYLTLFEQIWQDPEKIEDVTDRLCEHIASVYQENSPQRIYFLMLYKIFSEFLEDISEDVLPNDRTGYQDTLVWNKLYNFQRDAATGIINKLETYNGCILADSVGLGKTFTALAVIKYYELRNRSVLVLCPKKLADIPSPILFELDRGAHLKTIAAYKRPSEADKAKWVISDYFATDWLPADTPRQPLPVAVDLASLYHRLLRELVDIPAREAEPMQALVDRVGRIRQLQRHCEQLEAKRNREKQFNHKVEINAQLRAAREQLARLRQET